MARQQLVEVDNELFLWSEESEAEDDRDEAVALQRKMFNIQYLSRYRWKTSSKSDVKASRLDSNERISAKEVLEALRRIPNKHWKNNGRANVRPDGVEYIDSITLGLVSSASTLGRPLPSKATHSYKNLTRMLLRFFKQCIEEPNTFRYGCHGIVCTSIQLNRNYAAREHVDGNNVGPSWIIGLGDWTAGGQLFVEDPEGRERHVLTCDIPGRYREGDTCYGTSLDVHNRWARFDGRRMHFVRPFFGGDRFSLVFFATTRHAGVPAAAKSFLSVLGFPLPEKQAHAELVSCCRCSPFLSELKVDSVGRVIDISPQICDLSLTSIPWVSRKEVAVPTKTWKQVIREQKRRRTRMQENETAMIQRLKKRVRGKQRIDFV